MRACCLILSLAGLGLVAPAASQPASSPLGAFRTVELRNGGHVLVRHAATRGFVLRQGSLEVSRVALDGERLVIDRCPRHCPRGYRLEIEVAAPRLDGLAVSDGGRVRTGGGFPSQPAVTASVDSGGMIDMRSLAAARVAASVRQGGIILVRPGREMDADVSNGGNVTYWGDVDVRSRIRDGGVVDRGAAADEHRALTELDPPLGPMPPLPAPPRPPRPPRTH